MMLSLGELYPTFRTNVVDPEHQKQLIQHRTKNHPNPSYLTEHSYREQNSSSPSQDIPHILWNPKIHYRVHNSPVPISILRQIIPVYALAR
jgi:hypothetical protein